MTLEEESRAKLPDIWDRRAALLWEAGELVPSEERVFDYMASAYEQCAEEFRSPIEIVEKIEKACKQ